jgi:hypothetical protein
MVRLNKACNTLCVCAAIATLSGCGGSRLAIGPNPAQVRSPLVTQARNSNLVYVSDSYAATVSVYSWYGKLLGTLMGFVSPVGLCSDLNGNVFVTDFDASDIVEYAHNGAFPIRTLKDPGQRPYGCAVDPLTGDLAVTNAEGVSGGPTTLAIYAKAKGRPKIYSDLSVYQLVYCGYDDRGNLFADGIAAIRYDFILVELPKGGSALSTVKVNTAISGPGAVQWDGSYLTVTDGKINVIYRLVVSGSKAKVQGQTQLNGSTGLRQLWIAGNKVVAANVESTSPTGDVVFWNYPSGGNPTKTFGMLKEPTGVTVSVPPTR